MNSSNCGCRIWCGDDGDIDGPGTCKGLPIRREPLIEIVCVPRSSRPSVRGSGSVDSEPHEIGPARLESPGPRPSEGPR